MGCGGGRGGGGRGRGVERKGVETPESTWPNRSVTGTPSRFSRDQVFIKWQLGCFPPLMLLSAGSDGSGMSF